MKKGLWIVLSLAAITLPEWGNSNQKLRPELSFHFDSYLTLIDGFGAGFRLPASANSFLEFDASIFPKACEELDNARLTSFGVSWLAKANTNPQIHLLLGPGIEWMPYYKNGLFVYFKMGCTLPLGKFMGMEINVYPVRIQPSTLFALFIPKLQIGVTARL